MIGGIAKAGFLSEDAPRLEQWLKKGNHGSMNYMENNLDLRLDPRKLVNGTKTVLTVFQNYYPEYEQADGLPKLSKYAYGKDYHKVIKKKLQKVLDALQEFGNVQGRAFTDSAPILERNLGAESGYWMGGKERDVDK